MKILIKDLEKKVSDVFSKSFNEEDSKILTDCLIWAEMCGTNTQGIIKMTRKNALQNIVADYPAKILRETPVSAIIDGGKNPAIVVAKKMVEIATKKAKETGIAIVGSINTYSSNGTQSYFVEKLANQDLIGIMMSKSPGSTAPFNSIDPLFGTNPIGFAFPTSDTPIIFDAATSAMTFFGVIEAKARGEKLPEGVAIDENGNLTTDPDTVIEKGALLPFGNSHKASGLSMLVELLTGPLINSAKFDPETFGKEWGTTLIAINPNILVDIDEFKANTSEFVKLIKNSRTKGNEKIYFPHDRSRKNYDDCLASGFVEIDEIIYNQIFENTSDNK